MRVPVSFAVVAAAVLSGCGAKPPDPPSGVTVIAATPSRIDLSWTASGSKGVSGYVVERASLDPDAGQGVYAAIGNATGTTASDTSVDPNTGYQYRVHAQAGTQTSGPSAAVSAGPPPKPFSVVAAAPVGAPSGHFGTQLSMALDANGDPAVAYAVVDPTGSGDATQNAVYFASWDRVAYAWRAPVQVGLTGPIDTTPGQVQVSLARDASNGTWGVAYLRALDATDVNHQIQLAYSQDGGKTWTVSKLFTPLPANPISNPVLALAMGQAYVLYFRANDGLRYESGAQSADSATWPTIQLADNSFGVPVPFPAALALDGSGKPAMAYWVSDTASAGLQLLFQRPGTFTALPFANTGGQPEAMPTVAMAFSGAKARVVFGGVQPGGAFPLSATSSSDGMSWSNVATLTPDGTAPRGATVSLAVGSKGQAAVAYASQSGGSCGNPKLATSPDFAAWTTCSLARATNASSAFPVVAFGTADQLVGAFQALDGTVAGAPGVVVWRQ